MLRRCLLHSHLAESRRPLGLRLFRIFFIDQRSLPFYLLADACYKKNILFPTSLELTRMEPVIPKWKTGIGPAPSSVMKNTLPYRLTSLTILPVSASPCRFSDTFENKKVGNSRIPNARRQKRRYYPRQFRLLGFVCLEHAASYTVLLSQLLKNDK